MLQQWYEFGTSAQIAAAPQYGKSKLAELFMRQHAMNRVPFGLIDFHGKLFNDVLAFLAYSIPKSPVYILNPSDPHLINPFNPFRFQGTDTTAHISRLADCIIKAWGAENSNDLPTYERIIKAVLAVSAESGEPLHHAAMLLDRSDHQLREWGISVIKDHRMKNEWQELHDKSVAKNTIQWDREILATHNRLQRFIGSTSVKYFTGLPGGLDIDEIWNEGAILLVNIAPSPHLSLESAKVFGSLLQSEFLNAARMHMDEERPYFLYCNEFQGFATSDAVALINETPKCGLRLTFIYHHDSEFHEKPHIAEALQMGAQIKIAFGGLPYELAAQTAPDFWPNELNARLKKDDKIHYVTFHELEEHKTIGKTKSLQKSSTFGTTTNNSFTNGFTETESADEFGVTVGSAFNQSNMFGDGETEANTSGKGVSKSVQSGTRYRPRVERIVDGQEDYTMEEKRSKLAGRFMALKRGECFVKLPGEEAGLWKVPHVEEVLLNPDTILNYIKATQPNAIPFHEAEAKLKEQERTFLEKSKGIPERSRDVPRLRGNPRGKKKPPHLHPQE